MPLFLAMKEPVKELLTERAVCYNSNTAELENFEIQQNWLSNKKFLPIFCQNVHQMPFGHLFQEQMLNEVSVLIAVETPGSTELTENNNVRSHLLIYKFLEIRMS